MSLSRRTFLKFSAGAATFSAMGGLGFDFSPTVAHAEILKFQKTIITSTICPYCAVGCGLLVYTADEGKGRSINVEGDPDHPINEGALCAKGAGLRGMTENALRPPKPLYRAPGAANWKEVEWEWAYKEIAKRVKKTRDASFTSTNAKGETVNRTEAIVSLGSAALDNEECWTYQAIQRALGLVHIEHQARICHSPTVPALAESFGRGAMTNYWEDIANSDCVLMMGANPAENHPISFKWVMRAKNKGATLIHVDPRYTRTSRLCHIHAALRQGTDIAFLGGMINYILEKKLYFAEYVREYTNASFVVGDEFSFEEGIFSGFDAKTQLYDKSKWAFALDAAGVPTRDNSFKNPRCVMQLMKKHYSRYTLDMVSNVTGTPKEDLLKVYEAFAATGKPDRSGTVMYAMGWTHKSVGVQTIRTMSLVQLLLGNIGVAGGGVNAMRGEGNVQGSTDQGLLAGNYPGYISTPLSSYGSYDDWVKNITPVSNDSKSLNWWSNMPKYTASLLKAMYPEQELETTYQLLPKLDGDKRLTDYYWLNIFERMHKGDMQGLFAWGMNPTCSGANANKTREAFAKLDWLVNVNLYDNETASFWRAPGVDPASIKTEVFFFPCATAYEKEGTITNSSRLVQWRYRGPYPKDEVRPDGDIMLELFKEIRSLYEKEGGVHPELIKNLNIADWEDEHHEYAPRKVARLLNGYFLKDVTIGEKTYTKGEQVPAFAMLQADGSTTSGCWVLCGMCPDSKTILPMRRDKTASAEQARIHMTPNWAWVWPMNRRILYNRASVDAKGKPFAPKKAVIEWQNDKWVGDVVDGGGNPGTRHPFIMQRHGMGAFYGPGLQDGPFPEQYEPIESPFKINPFSAQRQNPVVTIFASEKLAVEDERFPIIGSTYRVTEHWQTGLMTRTQPWLVELEPQMFCEMNPELASLKGIENGAKVVISSARGEVEAVAIVTKRLKSFTVQNREVHQVGFPWHFGWLRPKDGGDSANLLTPSVGDPNTGIPEVKAFMVNVRKA